MSAIEFFAEDITFDLADREKTRQWILQVVEREQHQLIHLNYIFCSDAYLLEINQAYLQHDTLTDIITFDHSDEKGEIEGDIFISVERVQENASKLGLIFEDELHRVMIHGVLHLLGYDDKQTSQKTQMRKKEDAYLSLRHAHGEGRGST